jgi:hypothetical protein
VKRIRLRRWTRVLGRAVLCATASSGLVVFCLPPASVFQQWSADAGLWTPEETKQSDRQAAEIDALLRKIG